MAEFLYGHVYFHDRFAGILRQESGDRCSFTYDGEFLQKPEAIAVSLPPQTDAHIYPGRLHPYFDNLLAEGRQAAVQARWLGVPLEDRFARLLAFGGDCIGAVTVRDPKPRLATGEMPEVGRRDCCARQPCLNLRSSSEVACGRNRNRVPAG